MDAAGQEAMDKLRRAMESGKKTPSEAMAEAGKLIAKEVTDAGPVVKKETTSMMDLGLEGANSRLPEFPSVGKNIDLGIAQGVTDNSGFVQDAAKKVIQDAKTAADQATDAHSPSRLFRRETGKWIGQGIGLGIADTARFVAKKAENLIQSTLNAAKSAVMSGDFSGVGKDFTEALSKSLSERKDADTKLLDYKLDQKYEKVVKANAKAESRLEKANNKAQAKLEKSNDKAESALEKKISKTKDKNAKKKLQSELKTLKKSNTAKEKSTKAANDKSEKKLSAANTNKEKAISGANQKVMDAYSKAYAAEVERITSEAEEMIGQLSDDYQKHYDEIVAKQKSMKDTLMGINNIAQGNITRTLQKNVNDITKYQDSVAKLKGRLPGSLMDEILGMDTASANQYMAKLSKLSAAEYDEYIALWQQKEAIAEKTSADFYRDDLDNLGRQYEADLKVQMAILEQDMANAGTNVAQGFIDGLASQKQLMSKTMADICDEVIKVTKKKFKIASPSREFRTIGKQNIQGEALGVKSETPVLLREVDKTNDAFIDRFRQANLDAPVLRAKLASAVRSDVSRLPGSAAIRKAETATRNQTLSIDIQPGDVNLDGKPVGKQIARHVDVELGEIDARKRR
jgi:hypothetical protein